jgi:hypothetical protein
MAYRGAALCAFCQELPVAVCDRCGCPICQGHGITPGGWCWGCEKELRDDLDVAGFATATSAPAGERPNMFALVVFELRALLSLYDKGRVRRRFLSRTREEIAAWRRRAAIGRAEG